MSAWWNLIRKEYRMIRTSVLIQLAVLLLGGFWLIYLSQRHHPGLMIAPASLLVVFALFYPAIFMLKNVSWELKRTPHLWLHCPQPAWMLLSAKLATGLTYMLVLLALAAFFVYWALFSSYSPEMTGIPLQTLALFVTKAGIYAAIFVFAAGIYLASWATFIAVVIAAAKNTFGRFHVLAGLLAFFAASWGISALKETWLFEKLTHWGAIKVTLQSLTELMPPGSVHFNGNQVYTGEILFYVILTFFLFALSAWLINNRVEV